MECKSIHQNWLGFCGQTAGKHLTPLKNRDDGKEQGEEFDITIFELSTRKKPLLTQRDYICSSVLFCYVKVHISWDKMPATMAKAYLRNKMLPIPLRLIADNGSTLGNPNTKIYIDIFLIEMETNF